jgi:hypothetical protein
MLQVKNQLRVAGVKFDRAFPLLYSKNSERRIFRASPSRTPPTADPLELIGKVTIRSINIESTFST